MAANAWMVSRLGDDDGLGGGVAVDSPKSPTGPVMMRATGQRPGKYQVSPEVLALCEAHIAQKRSGQANTHNRRPTVRM